MRLIGVHTSIAGGLHLSVKRAHELGCTCMQIFSHSPRSWAITYPSDEEVESFKKELNRCDIKAVFIHSSYLINLCSPDETTRKKSVKLLEYELALADMLGVPYVVLHPGRAVGQPESVAIKKIRDALAEICSKRGGSASLLIENTAGQRGDVSSYMSLIAKIVDNLQEDCIAGICLDTAHALQAGYNLTTSEGVERLASEIKKYLHPLQVKLIHLNDSKTPFNSHTDRHQHIGMGAIGTEGFKKFLSCPDFRNIPLILETPKRSESDDRENLQRVKEILKAVDR